MVLLERALYVHLLYQVWPLHSGRRALTKMACAECMKTYCWGNNLIVKGLIKACICFLLAYLLTVLLSLMASTEPPSGIAIQPNALLPVVLSQSIDLMCTATGDPPINYAWVLTGAETTRLNSDPTSGDFTLSITQMNQYGVYICIATNVLGTDAASIEIIQASKSIS